MLSAILTTQYGGNDVYVAHSSLQHSGFYFVRVRTNTEAARTSGLTFTNG